MSDLVAFLTTQLDEAEQAAREGHIYSWHTRYCGNQSGSVMFGDCECDVPAAVLADVAAKRAILAMHAPEAGSQYCSAPCLDWSWSDAPAYIPCPCPTLRLLASAYSGCDGYRAEEWKP